MESFTIATKRKKRKTRKCLDEIRKRSRHTNQILIEKDDSKLGGLCSRNTQHCMITGNRLTLRMFPNAIQSKTITRPALLQLEHNANLNLEEVVKDNQVIDPQNASRIRIPLIRFTNNHGYFLTRRHSLDDHDFESPVLTKDPIVPNAEEIKESSELFSSMDELTTKSPIGTDTQSVSTACTVSTRSPLDDSAYSLYEEFMSEVPPCLQQNANLMQEDVMKKTKTLLQNLFIESCYQECEDNIVRCTAPTPRVLSDPRLYLAQGRSARSPRGSSPASGDSGAAPSPPAAPDTPHYTYYPHRLN